MCFNGKTFILGVNAFKRARSMSQMICGSGCYSRLGEECSVCEASTMIAINWPNNCQNNQTYIYINRHNTQLVFMANKKKEERKEMYCVGFVLT